MGDPVIHIELRKWADILIIYPLAYKTFNKIAMGLSDDLLTCVCRAWDFKRSPLIIVPTIDELTWKSSTTESNIKTLQFLKIIVLTPNSTEDEIINQIRLSLNNKTKLA